MTYVPAVEDGDFAAWYRTEHGRLLASLYVLTHDLESATEATDETFARALAAWAKVRQMSYPTAWLHRVGINLVLRQHRRRHSERKALAALPPLHSQPDLYEEVWDAVAALPLRQRTAVVLRYLSDLPEAAIAEAMGITRGAVAATLSAARQQLGRQLRDEEFPQEAPYA